MAVLDCEIEIFMTVGHEHLLKLIEELYQEIDRLKKLLKEKKDLGKEEG